MLGLFRLDTVVHRHAAEYHISFRIAEEDVERMVPFFMDPDGHLLELIAELADAPRPEFLYRPWRVNDAGLWR